MPVDMDALTASLRRLAARSDSDDDVVALLTEVTKACEDLFGVTGCGIMIADEQNITRYVAASDGSGRLLEMAEWRRVRGRAPTRSSSGCRCRPLT